MQGTNPGEALAVVELSRDNIQQVLEQSLTGPVIISFYAPSHPQSVAMNDTLARLIQGRCLLALVNCEAEMEIASYFRIQALSTVLVMSQGQPVDGFAGEKADADIGAILEQHLPPAWKQTLQDAKGLLASGDAEAAYTMLKGIETEAQAAGAEFQLAMADAELANGEIGGAEVRLGTIGLADQDGYYQSIKAKLALAKEAADTPEIRELQQKFNADPDNALLRIELARALAQAKREEEALGLLFDVLAQDLNCQGGDVKQAFMDILTAMGQGSALANQFRRKLYGLLY